MSKLNYKIGIAVLIVGGLGVAAMLKDSGKKSQTPRATNEAVAQSDARGDSELATRVFDLSDEVALLRARMARDVPSERAKNDAGASEPVAPPPKTPDEELQERREYMADVEASFHQERPDPNWARETATSIRQEAAEFPAIASVLRTYDCRATSCRVELGPSDSEEFARDLPSFFHQLSARLPTIQFDQLDAGNGKKTLVAYLSRESEASATSGATVE